METVTVQDFHKQVGKAFIILMIFIGFSVYRIVKGAYILEYISILSVSVLGAMAIRMLLILVEQKVITGDIRITPAKTYFLQLFIFFGLSTLSIYILIVKDVYVLYLLSKYFDFKILLYKILIIFTSYHLVAAASKMQTVLNALLSKKDNSFVKEE